MTRGVAETCKTVTIAKGILLMNEEVSFLKNGK